MLARRRRTFAVLGVLAIAAAGFGAWQLWPSSDDDAPPGLQRQARLGTEEEPVEPTLRELAGKKIKHVIYIIKENRSFDNYFARYPGANGATHGMTSTGERVKLTVAPDVMEPDIGHDFPAGMNSINGGKMDGFDLVANGESLSGYSSFTREGIPNYFSYADEFVLGDNMFSSMYGPTFPEHLYTVGAQSGRVTSNKNQAATPGGYCGDPTETVYRFQKLTKNEKKIVMTAEEKADMATVGNYWEEIRACLNFEVLPDQLIENDISWKYYADEGSWMNALLAIKHMYNSDHWGKEIIREEQFPVDIEKERLPEISWVIPGPGFNEHPGGPSVCVGENWTVDVVNKIMKSKYWKNTAIFITWDDFGGFYDHVPPPHYDIMGFGHARAVADHLAVGEAGARRLDRVRARVPLEVHRGHVGPRLYDAQGLRGIEHVQRVRFRVRNAAQGPETHTQRAQLRRLTGQDLARVRRAWFQHVQGLGGLARLRAPAGSPARRPPSVPRDR